MFSSRLKCATLSRPSHLLPFSLLPFSTSLPNRACRSCRSRHSLASLCPLVMSFTSSFPSDGDAAVEARVIVLGLEGCSPGGCNMSLRGCNAAPKGCNASPGGCDASPRGCNASRGGCDASPRACDFDGSISDPHPPIFFLFWSRPLRDHHHPSICCCSGAIIVDDAGLN